MAFGDEELMGLRAQLIAASHDPPVSDARRRPGLAAVEGRRTASPRLERDELLALLGHELRNPLAPVRQAVELLQAHATAHDPPYLAQARAVLVRQVGHLAQVVDMLLDIHGDPSTKVEASVPSPEPPADPSRSTARAVAFPRVLVVDDNEDAAEMLALVLRKRGYEVVLAFDGEEALAKAEAHQPRVVLLDIGLPGIDGYEVARRLRAKAATPRPVLVAVTGYGQPADRQRAREAGFDHHMVKPVAMEKLLPLLESNRE